MLFCCILLFCLHMCKANDTGTLLKNGTSIVLPSLGSLCPYTKFCQSGPIEELQSPDQISCCEECSCNLDCFETGSCCPDMPYTGFLEPKYPCRHLWHFGRNIESIPISDTLNYYHVIDDCPDLSKAFAFKKCYDPTDVDDYVMVYDKDTGNVYRNKHCAECNSIFTYAALKLQAVCENTLPSLANLSSIQGTQSYLIEKCSLKPLPPDNHSSLSKCLPQSEVISLCNYSGKWDFYDEDLEKACLSKTMDQNVIYRGILPTGIRYRYFANVYCFLCNVPVGTNINKVCDKINNNNNQMKSRHVTLFAIVDVKLWESIAEIKTGRICHETQIWDHIQKTCRQLFCPPGHIPNYGSCRTLLSNIHGYTFAVYFRVIFINESMPIGSVLMNYLEYSLIRELGHDMTCGKCKLSLLSEANGNSQFYFLYEMFATEGCRYDTLLERIRNIALKQKINLQFKYGGRVIRIQMILFFDEIPQETDDNVLYGNMKSICEKGKAVDEWVLQFCPAIVLPEEEVFTLGLRNDSWISDQVSSHVNYSETVLLHVCVDRYFSASQSRSAAAIMVNIPVHSIYELLIIVMIAFS